MGVVSQMHTYGATIDDQMIVEKVLRSLTSMFDHVVTTIEELKDLSVFSFDELMGSLQAHEVHINKTLEKVEEKTFQVQDNNSVTTKRGRGRGSPLGGGGREGRIPRRGRGRDDEQRKRTNFAREECNDDAYANEEEKLFMSQTAAEHEFSQTPNV